MGVNYNTSLLRLYELNKVAYVRYSVQYLTHKRHSIHVSHYYDSIKELLSKVLEFQWYTNRDCPQGDHYQLRNGIQMHK